MEGIRLEMPRIEIFEIEMLLKMLCAVLDIIRDERPPLDVMTLVKTLHDVEDRKMMLLEDRRVN